MIEYTTLNTSFDSAPWGYDRWVHEEVVPKPPPWRLKWRLTVTTKTTQPTPGFFPGRPATGNEDITVQLTADQQVDLSVRAEDAYDNPVTLTGDVAWASSDESVVTVTADTADPNRATAVAVGPTGTAAVTVTADPDSDTGTPNFQGSIAIDVVAGEVTEIVVEADAPVDKT